MKQNCIVKEDGTVSRKQKDILLEQQKFYQKLYTADLDISFTFKNTSGTQLTDSERAVCELPLTKIELLEALKSMKRNKTPGCDGLPMGFYGTFWIKLQDTLFEVLIECQRKGELFISARRGMISLIPKKAKNSKLTKNWRPLTLLNMDYKILAKVLAKRMTPFMENLIHCSQTGFMKGRNITHNIRTLIDIVNYADQEQIDVL